MGDVRKLEESFNDITGIEQWLYYFVNDKQVMKDLQWEESTRPQMTHFNDKTFLSPCFPAGYLHLDCRWVNVNRGYDFYLYSFTNFGDVVFRMYKRGVDVDDMLYEKLIRFFGLNI